MKKNPIRNLISLGQQWRTQDPFVFCAFHPDAFPGANDALGPKEGLAGRQLGQDFSNKEGWSMYHGKRVPGFPAHPHSGFETITIVTEGFVDHADSLGSQGRFGEGDAQWMTAGKGVLHSEMFPLLNPDENPFQLFQIWLNLPDKSRGVSPHYKMFWKEDIPVYQDKGLEVTIIAGSFGNMVALPPPPESWAASPQNDVQIWKIKIEPGERLTIPKSKYVVNRSLFFFEGDTIRIHTQNIKFMDGVELDPAEEVEVENTSTKSAHLIFLQGKAINEPYVQHGPFIAATRKDLQKVSQRYLQTQFGGWPWETQEPIFDRDAGRFSKNEKSEFHPGQNE